MPTGDAAALPPFEVMECADDRTTCRRNASTDGRALTRGLGPTACDQRAAVRIWTSRPSDVEQGRWGELAALLGEAEQAQSRRFRFESDRQAYVLVHAIRRLAVARELAVEPSEVAFAQAGNGKPILAAPQPGRAVFFSHSRSRDAVVCAVTRACPVGIDVEARREAAPDFGLLARFMTVPDETRRRVELGLDAARQFYFYWTALEAFWKAAGVGLSASNPRIILRMNEHGWFEVALDTAAWRETAALVIPVSSSENCTAAIALHGLGSELEPPVHVTQLDLKKEWLFRTIDL